jgi:hypothetical protein
VAYAPTSLPAASAVVVGTGAVQITVPGAPKKGVLLLQRSGDSDKIYFGFSSAVTTSTGVLVTKGDPGSVTSQYLIPADAFISPGLSFWVISGSASQNLDVVIV